MALQGLHFYLHGLKFSGSRNPKGRGAVFRKAVLIFWQIYDNLFSCLYWLQWVFSLLIVYFFNQAGSLQVEVTQPRMRAGGWNEVTQLQQCTVAEGLSHSQLQPLETLVFRKKRNPQIPEEGSAREEEQSAQGLAWWLVLLVRVGREGGRVLCARLSCETLGNAFPIRKHSFALCGCFLYTPSGGTTVSSKQVQYYSQHGHAWFPFFPFQGN